MTEQKPLKLEVGKTYLSRDGVKFKIVDMRVHTTHRYTAENGCHYAVDGNFYGECSEFDLIEECEPERQKPKNPPAFPTTPVRNDGVLDLDCYPGMTLRDYYAAHAPITLEEARAVHAYRTEVSFEQIFLTWAQMRFAYADAMLRARAA